MGSNVPNRLRLLRSRPWPPCYLDVGLSEVPVTPSCLSNGATVWTKGLCKDEGCKFTQSATLCGNFKNFVEKASKAKLIFGAINLKSMHNFMKISIFCELFEDSPIGVVVLTRPPLTASAQRGAQPHHCKSLLTSPGEKGPKGVWYGCLAVANTLPDHKTRFRTLAWLMQGPFFPLYLCPGCSQDWAQSLPCLPSSLSEFQYPQ